jgi:hypothetical protein
VKAQRDGLAKQVALVTAALADRSLRRTSTTRGQTFRFACDSDHPFLTRLRTLRRGVSNGQYVPHKPLLLLWVLAGCNKVSHG